MRAGRLRHRLRFERATETQNQFGEPVQSWDIITVTWGAIEPLRGAERQRANQTAASEDVRIVARYNSEIADLKPDDRCAFKLKIYDIKAILNIDERNKEIHVMAKEHIDGPEDELIELSKISPYQDWTKGAKVFDVVVNEDLPE